MIKIDLKAEEQTSLDFLEKIRSNPIVKDYDVNLNNVNDFALYIQELEQCHKCQCLQECKNQNPGFMIKPEEDSFVLVPCKFKKEALLKSKETQLIKTLFVSKKILNADLSQMDVKTTNRKKIMSYILDFVSKASQHIYAKGLYLYGGFSTGKTFILGCIANELAKQHIETLVIYFPDLVVELKSSIGSSRFEELMNYLKSVDVLLLDDLGSENMTSWLRDEVLGPVLNYRLMEEKPVFISSNIDPTTSDLISHLSGSKAPQEVLKATRIQSRLEGLVMPIELDNESYRR